MTTAAAAERIYLHDDPQLSVRAEPDAAVRGRHIARYERAIRLANKRGGTWLDCACGSGYGAELIASTADHVLALDSDLHAIRYARKHHARPNVRYLAVPIVEAMFHAFRVGGLTAILSIETLEHLPLQEQRAWVATAASLLGTDGTFVVCCPVRTTAGGGSANPWHVYEPTEAELGDMLGTHFGTHEITTEPYESTSGPAVQAWAVARTPRVPR